MHYEEFKRKPINWGIPENEIWRRYQLFMEQEMFKQLHLQLIESNGESSSSSSSASAGGGQRGGIPEVFLPFISVWRTTTGNETVTLPYLSTGSFTGTIDWGDGEISDNSYDNRIHTYATPGDYTITIDGRCEGFRFDGAGDALKIIKVVRFGDLFWGGNVFWGCRNLDLSEVEDIPNFRGTTYLGLSLRFCSSMTYIKNVHLWNMNGVTNLDAMFDGCTNFIGEDPEGNGIGQWDTSTITVMNNMFRSCSNLNTDIGGWDVSRVSTMGRMFGSCGAFNNGGSDSIKNWKFRAQGGVYFREFLINTSSFNQPIGEWKCLTSEPGVYAEFKPGNVTGMFRGNTSFNYPIGDWDMIISSPDTQFMNRSAASYSPENLDDIYIKWSSKPVIPTAKTFGFGAIKYTSAGQAGKDILVNEYGWTIVDGGQVV